MLEQAAGPFERLDMARRSTTPPTKPKPLSWLDKLPEAERREYRRQHQEKRRRAMGVRPREEYLAEAATRTMPWLKWGVCRRTWQARGKPIFDESERRPP